MSKGINKVILVGNLGNDPDISSLPSGDTFTRISIATSDKWTDKASGQLQERTEWHKVVCFGRLAEICGEYLQKGSKVYIEGALRTNKWTDKGTGQPRYATEIVASEMQMLDSRKPVAEEGMVPANSSKIVSFTPPKLSDAEIDDIPW
tara:strand:- start:1551 stop:1994 length:444 start_codon:yes stop_codon:yes gene_type:complete